MTTDEGFSLPVPLALNARQCAEKLLRWMPLLENKPKAVAFAISLVKMLRECCGSQSKSMRVRKEKMWEKYYHLRCTEDFVASWSRFIRESISEDACPIFYQFVTDHVFEEVIQEHFSMKDQPSKEITSYFSYEELNALRYTAGYVIKAVLQKIEKSKSYTNLREEMVLCLTDLKEKEERAGMIDSNFIIICEPLTIITESHRHQSSDWVDRVDRGGLQHVNDIAFTLFATMELEFRRHIDISDGSEIKSKAIENILESDDVQVYWESLSSEWEDEVASILLKLIVEHWVTIRGYSQASAFLEHYKQSTKAGVQKSKGLRKKLF